MYCGECGAKLEKGATFCGECGAAVKSNQQRVSTEKTTPKQVPPKEPMSKQKKALLMTCVVVIIALFFGYNYLSDKFGPKSVAKEYVEALRKKDADALYGYLNIEGDNTFASKEKFKEVIKKSKSTQEIKNYTIEGVVYGEGKLSARVKVNYTMDGSQSEISETIHLVKSKEKKFLIFDSWEVKENYDSILVKDYQIKVPKNSKVTVEKVTLDKKYLDKESSTKSLDVYTIPQIFATEITIKTNIAGFDIEDKVTPSGYSYTASLDLKSLSKESVSSLETQLKNDITALYQNLIQKKDWTSVKEMYNFEGADLEDLEEVYGSLYEDVAQNEDKTLKSFEVTSMKINSLSSEEDGIISVAIRFGYNYTIDYKRYDDTIQEKTGKNTNNATLYYANNNGTLKLVDAAYLVSYFSSY